jgi:hypothetical protein
MSLVKKYGKQIADRDLGGWMCAYCYRTLLQTVVYEERLFRGRPYLAAVVSGSSACVDHVVPRLHGGPDHIDNYVLSCFSCNARKSWKLLR